MATRILTNGKIFTANKNEPWAEAVVLQDNKIAYVGSTQGALEFAGGNAQAEDAGGSNAGNADSCNAGNSAGGVADVCVAGNSNADSVTTEDLGGKLVTPGLIDGHLHVFAATMFDGLLRLDALTPEQMFDAIAKDVAANPQLNAYTGMGWFDEAFGEAGPNKADLDAICPDKPMAYLSASMHTVWCNSRALEVAGINRDTPDIDPAGGVVYVRDAEGNPTGYCKEIAAMDKVMGAAKYFNEEAMAKAMDSFNKLCAQHGITSLVDCGAISFMKFIMSEALCNEVDTDQYPVRINFCGFAGVSGLYEIAFDDAVEFSKKFDNDRFFCTFHKLFNDGTTETTSAAIPNPYPNGNVIAPIMSVEELVRKYEECAGAGIDVNIHAIGSDAIRNVLQAAGIVRERGLHDLRIVCSHSSNVYPEDIELFGKYNVFSNTTGLWVSSLSEEEDALTRKLTEAKPYPMKSILGSGARVGLGSDFPTDPTSFPPMQNAECLITRQPVGEAGGFVHDANEALSVEDVLLAYTINNAYQMRKEDVLGSIEVGKYADLVVFNENLFEVDPHEIHNVTVAETIKDGITTYKA